MKLADLKRYVRGLKDAEIKSEPDYFPVVVEDEFGEHVEWQEVSPPEDSETR